MGDSGEGLIDADARIQERIDDMERARTGRRHEVVRDPGRVQALESLRLARTELERQLTTTTHERRRVQIQQALAELDRRMADVGAGG
jgi:hypothetical protein